MYICIKCRKTFEIDNKVMCQYCGFRVIAKARPAFKKRVIAR